MVSKTRRNIIGTLVAGTLVAAAIGLGGFLSTGTNPYPSITPLSLNPTRVESANPNVFPAATYYELSVLYGETLASRGWVQRFDPWQAGGIAELWRRYVDYGEYPLVLTVHTDHYVPEHIYTLHDEAGTRHIYLPSMDPGVYNTFAVAADGSTYYAPAATGPDRPVSRRSDLNKTTGVTLESILIPENLARAAPPCAQR